MAARSVYCTVDLTILTSYVCIYRHRFGQQHSRNSVLRAVYQPILESYRDTRQAYIGGQALFAMLLRGVHPFPCVARIQTD